MSMHWISPPVFYTFPTITSSQLVYLVSTHTIQGDFTSTGTSTGIGTKPYCEVAQMDMGGSTIT